MDPDLGSHSEPSNESLQLTGAGIEEVVVAAALVPIVSSLHLPRQHVARS